LVFSTKGSTGANDVTIKVTVDGKASVETTLTIKQPKRVVVLMPEGQTGEGPGGPYDQADAGSGGYLTIYRMKLVDQFDQILPFKAAGRK
jgi:hypothetical protein